MDYAYGVLVFVFGLSVGSFLCVCIDRLPNDRSIVNPPSHCEACGHKLGFLDLIPVVSYLVLRGRCRYCKAKIPANVIMVELFTALLFTLFWYYYGISRELAFALIYGGFFVVIFFIDLKHYLVLNKVVYPAIVIALIVAASTQFHDIKIPLLGGLVGSGLLFMVAVISRGGMGMGDVKLALFIGIIVGLWHAFVFLLVSVIIGGVFAAGLLFAKKKGRKESIPFAPFLILGGVVTMLYGDRILDFLIGRW